MTRNAKPGLARRVKAERAILPLDMAAYHAVHDYQDAQGRVGAPAVAAAFSWKATTLTNKLNPNEERNILSVRELECIATLTRDERLLDSLCSTMGAVWIPLPVATGASMGVMLQRIGEASAQLGNLAKEYGEAIQDGEISEDELSVMEKTAMRITQEVQGMLAQARADFELRRQSR